MLSDNIKALYLAGERYAKLPTRVTIPAGKRVYYISGSTGAMGEVNTLYQITVDCIGYMAKNPSNNYGRYEDELYRIDNLDSYDFKYVTNTVSGSWERVKLLNRETEQNPRSLGTLANFYVPVSDVIGGVISTLFAKFTHLLSWEVVVC